MKTDAAKLALQRLLDASGISHVVYIDDVFAFQQEVDVEQAIGWFAQALSRSEERSLALVSVIYPVDDDIWRSEFRSKWSQLNPNERMEIIVGLSGILNSQLTKDTEIASQLMKLFPTSFDYRQLSPSAWIEQKHVILAETSRDSRIICLFDQDLSAESGFAATGSQSGGGLLKDLMENRKDSTVLCGILSHTIPSIEHESDYYRTFVTEYQIGELEPERFLPLAKLRLEDPMKFVDGLKKLLLNEIGERIKHATLDVLHNAQAIAMEKIRSFDIYTFDRIVLKSAHRENESEIETIVRLFQIYQRNEVRRQLADPNLVDSLFRLIMEARPTSQVETVNEEYVYPNVRRIRREELYENGGIIQNRPIESGDIFVSRQGTKDEKAYILLAQPCDLAVRLDGTRTQEFVSLVFCHR